MKPSIWKHLFESRDVRKCLVREAVKLAFYLGMVMLGVVLIRYLTDRPILEGVASAAIGCAAIAIATMVSAIRTVRAVLREEKIIE
jgi:hypothetical protein